MRLTDEQLASVALADSTAMAELMVRYKGVVRAVSRSFFLEGGDVDDLIQEGMLGIFKAVKSYDDTKDASFRSFAILCIRRSIIDAVKSSTRSKHKPLNDYLSIYIDESSDDVSPDVFIDPIDPEKKIIMSETSVQLRQDIRSVLDEFEQKILGMYLRGNTYNEIAESVSRTTKYVDNKLQSIKKKLKVVLQKYI
ncbi:MAG: sigma-70 family RNA polymerase sigma factor [Clostridia bacterium]|nr:sigma-70 family RNA polymerase sigma factor [Clostridia bacterium]